MKFKNLALALLGCTLLAGCGGRPDSIDGDFTVDFHDYVEKPLAEMPDKFYSEKRYVALHSDEQDLMIGEIGKVVLYGDRIYVSEQSYGPRSRHALIVHDAEGSAVAKIGNQGRGPGEYLQISDFDVDWQGRVHLMDGTFGNKKILIYDANGRFVEEKKLPFSAELIKCTPDGGFLMVISTWEESEGLAGRRFVKTNADLNVLNVAGEWDMSQVDNNFILGDGCLVATPDGIFSQHAPFDELYRLDEDGNITATWFLDLGRYGIPPENRGNLEALYDAGKMESFRIFGDFVAPAGRYLFGSMRDRGVMTTLVYDLETGVNYTLREEESTHFEGFIPISDGRLVSFFPYFDGETLPSDLPEALHAGVMSGDPLICLYELK